MKSRKERIEESQAAITKCGAEAIKKGGSLCRKAKTGECKNEGCPAWADWFLLSDVFSVPKV